jgi:hypothetical protein
VGEWLTVPPPPLPLLLLLLQVSLWQRKAV